MRRAALIIVALGLSGPLGAAESAAADGSAPAAVDGSAAETGRSASAEPCPAEAGPACFREGAAPLLAGGRSKEALALLKEGARRFPADGPLTLLLAGTYLRDGNDVWALRTLAGHTARHPDGCEVRSWLAWMRLRRADLSGTRRVLTGAEGCPDGGPSTARWALMEALVARYQEAPTLARERVLAARAAPAVWPEDAALLETLSAQMVPGWSPPVRARLDLQAGGTSNALSGSPTDGHTAEGTPSALSRLDLFAEAVWPAPAAIRPALSLDLRTQGLAAEPAQALSWADVGVRPGVVLLGSPRLLLAYRYDGLRMAGGDPMPEAGQGDGYWLFHTHRAEVELESESFTAFAGAGGRQFRTPRRSRLEIDLGAGGRLRAGSRFQALWALSVRRHDAVYRAYDLWGASAVGALQLALPGRVAARLGLTAGLDDYLDSAALPDRDFGIDGARRDLLLKASLGASRPFGAGLRLGLTGEISRRLSTATSYAYTELRILGTLAWSLDLDPTAPRVAALPGHVPLDWGTGGEADLDDERIQDLLRQDESARRGSSCVN